MRPKKFVRMIKKTKEPCFSNGTEFMVWQDENCCQCKKAVWYNQKLDKYPQYRCAVQKQIEGQAVGIDEISQRTYDATHKRRCPFFKSKVEEKPKEEVLDFSKGESLFNELPLFNNIEHDQNIEQASPAKVQENQSKPQDAALLKLARETGVSYEALKDAERRMFDTIATKAQLPPMFREQAFKSQIKSDVRNMLETFTWKENMMIAFVPLVIAHLAFIYSDKVLEYCKEHRISETLKLSRAVKHIRQEYLSEMKKDLNAAHIRRIEEQTEQFMQLYAHDFTILWWCVNGQYKRQFPDAPLKDMKTDAFVSVLMCRFLDEHNKRMDKIIAAKMGQANSIKNPYIDKLETCMDAYCGNQVIECDANIKACMKILEKNINEIEFDVEDEEPGK